MLKSLLFAAWTVAVIVCAFIAGRWVGAGTVLEESKPDGKPVVAVARPADKRKALMYAAADTITPYVNPKPSYASDREQLPALLQLAASNPELAMEKAQQLKGALRAQAELAILDVWGARSPYGAWNWVEKNRSLDARLFMKVLEAAGRSEPQTALAYAQEMVASHRELRRDIYTAAVTGLAQGGAYSQAMAAIDKFDIEADTRQELRRLVLENWAVYEPDAAAQWLKSQPDDAVASGQLVKSWADVDAQAATNFAASLTGAGHDELLLWSFRQWLDADPATATSWLLAQQGGQFDALRNEAATAPAMLDGQVQRALDWASQMADPEQRINTLASILAACKQKDPRAAADYLQKISYLNDTERNRLYQDLAFAD